LARLLRSSVGSEAQSAFAIFNGLAERLGRHEAFSEGGGEMELLRVIYEREPERTKSNLRWPSSTSAPPTIYGTAMRKVASSTATATDGLRRDPAERTGSIMPMLRSSKPIWNLNLLT
jgi:hypothetical protein